MSDRWAGDTSTTMLPPRSPYEQFWSATVFVSVAVEQATGLDRSTLAVLQDQLNDIAARTRSVQAIVQRSDRTGSRLDLRQSPSATCSHGHSPQSLGRWGSSDTPARCGRLPKRCSVCRGRGSLWICSCWILFRRLTLVVILVSCRSRCIAAGATSTDVVGCEDVPPTCRS